MESLKKAAEGLRSTIFKSPLEKQLNEATSNDNWGVSNTTLHSIADASHDWEQFEIIMKFTWDKVNNTKPKEWRRIYKTLQLLEFLLKFGSPRVGSQISDNLFKLRGLQDFSHSEDGNERGSGVREKARLLVDLISDSRKLEEEREKSKQVRSKFIGMSSEDTYHYQEKNYSSQNYGNYGGGYGNYNTGTSSNYKDRIQGFGSDTQQSSYPSTSNYQSQRKDQEWGKGYGGFIEPQGNIEEREKQRKQEWQQQQQQRKDQGKINFSIKPTQTTTQQATTKNQSQLQQQQVQQPQQNKITIQPKQVESAPVKQEQKPQASLIDFEEQQVQQPKTTQNQNILESIFETPATNQNTQDLFFSNQQQKQQEQQQQVQNQQRNEKIHQITNLFSQQQPVSFSNTPQQNLFPGQQIPGMQQPGFQNHPQMPISGFQQYPGQPPMYYNQNPQQQWGYQQPPMMYQNMGYQQQMPGFGQVGYVQQQQQSVPSNLKNQGQSMNKSQPAQLNQAQKQPVQKTKKDFESSISNLEFL